MFRMMLVLYFVGAVGLAMPFGTVAALTVEATEIGVVGSPDDLIKVLQDSQRLHQPISPPSLAPYIDVQDIPIPVLWDGFDKRITKYMVAEMDEYGLPRYHLLLWEDVRTRERVIALASTGYEIARIPAPKDYQPEAYYVSLLANGGTYSEAMRWIFDRAHTMTEVALIPESLYSGYEELEADKIARDELETALAIESMALAPISMIMSTMGAGTELAIDPNLSMPFEEGWLDLANTESGHEYEFYFTDNLVYRPFSTNGTSSSTAWLVKTGLQGNGGSLRWDVPLVAENGMNRPAGFFRAYRSDDYDGDGLSDAYELMMIADTNKADYLVYDTNGNGVRDGDEDADGDTLTNRDEYLGLTVGVHTDPAEKDSDSDGIDDDVDPWPMDFAGKVDTDGDRMPDELNGASTSYPLLIEDLDDDNDGLSDLDEVTIYGSNPLVHDSMLDNDNDGVLNILEHILGTSSSNPNDPGPGSCTITVISPYNGQVLD